jgi:hypothetical protein
MPIELNITSFMIRNVFGKKNQNKTLRASPTDYSSHPQYQKNFERAPTDYLTHYQYLIFFSNYSKSFLSPSNLGDSHPSHTRGFYVAGRHL